MAHEPESAAVRAYEHIRDGIIEGRYETGEMLGESGLAAELSMSRTPIRAALVRLQEEQWITVYPKRGALVKGLSDRAISDLSDTRYILESAAVQRADGSQIAALTAMLTEQIAEQQAALEAQDVHRFVDLTTAFHRSFVEVCGNQVLLELSDRLADRQRYMLFKLEARLLEQCQLILDEHRELVHSLQAGDPARFAESLRKHINDVHTERVAPLSKLP
ncbi:GntR family transcriptional regulator [Leucobacter ruminantium]|uniref:GntR family transcriptional regulator n=1 Tax=Leucobacter ruminantium TaxID=1289170 RepID=A0A939LTJ8_9MICO|nr:GntR family transcriptional regulator [Leucobacter ruminantium]MBO1804499.1 GntR family transcriptional regulator [Leucobacter ruminantium]